MPAAERCRTTRSAPCLVRVKTSTRANNGSRQQSCEQLPLLGARDEDDALIDELDGRRGGGDGHLDRIVEVGLGEGGDRWRHRCREQQGLPLLRQQLDDALQRVDEAEIEHPVSLIQNQHLDAR